MSTLHCAYLSLHSYLVVTYCVRLQIFLLRAESGKDCTQAGALSAWSVWRCLLFCNLESVARDKYNSAKRQNMSFIFAMHELIYE